MNNNNDFMLNFLCFMNDVHLWMKDNFVSSVLLYVFINQMIFALRFQDLHNGVLYCTCW
jgi:hypothetical protein